MSGAKHWEQDREATIYVGNLDERVADSLVWELFLQAGRIVNVHLPKDRVTQSHQGYGFVEFISEEDAEYAARIMNQVRLFGKPIRVNKASADKAKSVEVGAELFVGNLDPMVDERMLYETFGRFGTLIAAPKVARDEANLSKGYGFVSYANFEASDDAVANMNGQYLMNKEISVQYAYKKDGKGERHGDQAERMLAAQARAHGVEPTAAPISLGGPAGAAGAAAGGAPAGGGGGGAVGGMGGPPNGYPSTPTGFAPPNIGYPNGPLPPHARPPPPSAPLGAPPVGLPARPPPSQAGYGGPSQPTPPPGSLPQMGYGAPPPPPPGFPMPPGFGGMPHHAQGFPQPPAGFVPPPGFGPPPSGFPPPQNNQPPPMPAGFQNFGMRK